MSAASGLPNEQTALNPPAASASSRAVPWLTVVAIIFLRGMNIYAWTFNGNIIDDIQSGLNASVASTGQGPAMLEAGIVVSCVAISPISDTAGAANRKHLTLAMAVGWSLSVAVVMLASTPAAYVVPQFFAGLFSAQFGTLGMRAIADLEPDNPASRSRLVAITGMSNGIFSIIAPLLSGLLVDCFHEWQGAFVGSAVLGAALVLLVWMFYPSEAAAAAADTEVRAVSAWDKCSSSVDIYRTLLTSPRFLSYGASDFFVHGPVYVWGWGASYMLQDRFGYSSFDASVTYTCVVGIPLVLGSLLTPSAYWLLGERGAYVMMSVAVIAFGMVDAAVGYLLLQPGTSAQLQTVFITATTCLFLAWAIVITAMYDLAIRDVPQYAATAVGIIFITQSLGSILFAELFAAPAIDPSNPMVIGFLMGGASTAGLATYLIFDRIAAAQQPPTRDDLAFETERERESRKESKV